MRRALATGLAALAIAGAVGVGTATATPIWNVRPHDNGYALNFSFRVAPSAGPTIGITSTVWRWDARDGAYRAIAGWGRWTKSVPYMRPQWFHTNRGIWTGDLRTGRYWLTVKVGGINEWGRANTHTVAVRFWHTHRNGWPAD